MVGLIAILVVPFVVAYKGLKKQSMWSVSALMALLVVSAGFIVFSFVDALFERTVPIQYYAFFVAIFSFMSIGVEES